MRMTDGWANKRDRAFAKPVAAAAAWVGPRTKIQEGGLAAAV